MTLKDPSCLFLFLPHWWGLSSSLVSPSNHKRSLSWLAWGWFRPWVPLSHLTHACKGGERVWVPSPLPSNHLIRIPLLWKAVGAPDNGQRKRTWFSGLNHLLGPGLLSPYSSLSLLSLTLWRDLGNGGFKLPDEEAHSVG